MAKETQAPIDQYFDVKAKEAKDNGKDIVISLTNKRKVEFTKDYGFMRIGHTQEVSDQAFEIYNKAGVIKEVKE